MLFWNNIVIKNHIAKNGQNGTIVSNLVAFFLFKLFNFEYQINVNHIILHTK